MISSEIYKFLMYFSSFFALFSRVLVRTLSVTLVLNQYAQIPTGFFFAIVRGLERNRDLLDKIIF